MERPAVRQRRSGVPSSQPCGWPTHERSAVDQQTLPDDSSGHATHGIRGNDHRRTQKSAREVRRVHWQSLLMYQHLLAASQPGQRPHYASGVQPAISHVSIATHTASRLASFCRTAVCHGTTFTAGHQPAPIQAPNRPRLATGQVLA